METISKFHQSLSLSLSPNSTIVSDWRFQILPQNYTVLNFTYIHLW